MKQMTFAAACNSYFGKLPNQTNAQFLQELKRLPEKARADLTQMFTTVGIEIIQHPLAS